MTMLAPGTYHLSGQLKGVLRGRRGLVWRMFCADGGRGALGESAMFLDVGANWRPFEFPIVVPNAGCRAQRLSLELDARSASEQLVTGSMWFDELQISRVAAKGN